MAAQNKELLKLLHEKYLELLQAKLAIILGSIATAFILITNIVSVTTEENTVVTLLIVGAILVAWTYSSSVDRIEEIEAQFGYIEKKGIVDEVYSYLNKSIKTSESSRNLGISKSSLLELLITLLIVAVGFILIVIILILFH